MLQEQFVARSAALERILADAALEHFTVDNNGRAITDVAQDVLRLAGWIPAALGQCAEASHGEGPRCGAKARTHGGQSCQAAPVLGKKRCRMHGGLSAGPRTPEGLERRRRGRWVHDRFSRDAIAARRRANWETVEQGVARILREERRAERNIAQQVRGLSRTIDRLLEAPDDGRCRVDREWSDLHGSLSCIPVVH
jgi:hypothetical protein